MIFEDSSLIELQCSLSNDGHFVENAFKLTKCGHLFCQSCLPVDSSLVVKCRVCGVQTEKNLINRFEVARFEKLFEEKKISLFKTLDKCMSLQLAKLRSILVIKIFFYFFFNFDL